MYQYLPETQLECELYMYQYLPEAQFECELYMYSTCLRHSLSVSCT